MAKNEKKSGNRRRMSLLKNCVKMEIILIKISENHREIFFLEKCRKMEIVMKKLMEIFGKFFCREMSENENCHEKNSGNRRKIFFHKNVEKFITKMDDFHRILMTIIPEIYTFVFFMVNVCYMQRLFCDVAGSQTVRPTGISQAQGMARPMVSHLYPIGFLST